MNLLLKLLFATLIYAFFMGYSILDQAIPDTSRVTAVQAVRG